MQGIGRINWSRVILGGLLGGIVFSITNILKGVAVPAFGEEWAAAMALLGIDMQRLMQSQAMLAWFMVDSILFILVAVWLYAAIRPRFGAGMRTAVYAGVAVWLIGYLLPMIGYASLGGSFRHVLCSSARR
ncbi:MAG: hypothetical protein IBX64_05705 [Actinobacteria bacterium]|nr:hypothetical protein [Actinomycetota bacterium]